MILILFRLATLEFIKLLTIGIFNYMFPLNTIIKILKDKSNKRFDDFKVDDTLKSIKKIAEDAYLDNPTWLGGDEEFVCLFIDLDNSSKLSFKKHPQTMAKIYDYFTQNVIDIMNQDGMRADYIDIKGDGAFGIYEGDDASLRAFCAGMTFKTFFEKYIRSKFQLDNNIINCKLSIDKDKILVRKLGKRGDRNNNEVWAGRVVNNTSKISGLSKEIYKLGINGITPNERSLFIISDKIYKNLLNKKEYAVISCGHDEKGNESLKVDVWQKHDCSNNEEVFGDHVWFTGAVWCDKCGENYMKNILTN